MTITTICSRVTKDGYCVMAITLKAQSLSPISMNVYTSALRQSTRGLSPVSIAHSSGEATGETINYIIDTLNCLVEKTYAIIMMTQSCWQRVQGI